MSSDRNRCIFFFFQAEDGIRDLTVTGVQTCALPILQPLYERAQKMSKAFDSFRVDHVYRERNREADALVNEALDETEGKPADSATPAKSNAPEKSGPRRIPARFRGGVLYLLEDVGLPDGTVVEVSIFPSQKRESS